MNMTVNKELILSNIYVDLFMEKLCDIPGNITLVFDDYHLISDGLVKRSLEYFIKNTASNIHIILSVACRFSGSNRHIDSFMQNEVFECWSNEVKEFLTHTSFLDRLCGPLCSRVTGNAKSEELLKMLSESNSFIIPLDNENKWFRYHHLFQEFLMNRLEKECISTQHTLYSLAGQWYLGNGYIQDSINCFINAEQYEKAFPLVWDIYLMMTQNGEYSTWRKWMDSMPEELCESDVRACTGYSWVLSMDNRLDKAEVWADKAQVCFDRIKNGLNKKDKTFWKPI